MCSYVAYTQLHQQMETNIVVGQRRLYKGHTVCEDYVHAMMCPWCVGSLKHGTNCFQNKTPLTLCRQSTVLAKAAEKHTKHTWHMRMHILHSNVLKSHECCELSNDTGFIFASCRPIEVTCSWPGPHSVLEGAESWEDFHNPVIVLHCAHFHEHGKFETFNEIMSGWAMRLQSTWYARP